jgi:hypothetical protein
VNRIEVVHEVSLGRAGSIEELLIQMGKRDV